MSWPPKARIAQPRQPRKQPRRNNDPEAQLQMAMVEYLDLALLPSEVWWSATLNGVRLTKRQAAKAKAQGLRKGLFDLIFVKLTGPEAGQTFHFEVKSATGSLTPEQKDLMAVLWPVGRGASGKSVEQLCAALIAWDMPVRARV